MKITNSARREQISNLYDAVDKIQPIAQKEDGSVIVDFADAAAINSLNAFEGNHGTGMQTRNADGTLASTGKRVHAINPDYFFLNRVKKKGKKLYVVSGHEPSGYRCIREQANGRTFIKSIPCYVITRDSDGNLCCESRTTIGEREFIEEFNDSLSNALMAEILPLIVSVGEKLSAIDKMPI